MSYFRNKAVAREQLGLDGAGLVGKIDTQLGSTDWRSAVGGFIAPEDYGCVGDGVVDDTVNFQAFADDTATTPGMLTGGATYLVDTVDIPSGARIFGPRSAIVKSSTSADSLVTIAGSDVLLDGFTIDGDFTTDTVAGGFDAMHFGVEVYNGGTEIFNVVLRRLLIKNFGESAIEARVVTDCQFVENEVTRCGYGGIMTWSGLNVRVAHNKISNIFPGNGGSAPFLNAYGATFSNFSGERVSTHCVYDGNDVSDIPSWEGLDEHNGQYISFVWNRIYNCSQGIAVQHATAGQIAKHIHIEGNTVIGFGASRVKDSTTFYSVGGIICNGSHNSEAGESLVIANNIVTSCGDTRPSPGGSGAIKIESWRGYQITGNLVYVPYMHGIYLYDDNTNDNLYGVVSGNLIDGTQEISSTRYPFRASARSLAICNGNFAQGSATGGNYFYQAGGYTFETTFADNRSV